MYQMEPNSKDPLSWITQSVNPRVVRITHASYFFFRNNKKEEISQQRHPFDLNPTLKKCVTWQGLETLLI